MVIVYGENFTIHHCFGRFGMVDVFFFRPSATWPPGAAKRRTRQVRNGLDSEFRGKYMVVS